MIIPEQPSVSLSTDPTLLARARNNGQLLRGNQEILMSRSIILYSSLRSPGRMTVMSWLIFRLALARNNWILRPGHEPDLSIAVRFEKSLCDGRIGPRATKVIIPGRYARISAAGTVFRSSETAAPHCERNLHFYKGFPTT